MRFFLHWCYTDTVPVETERLVLSYAEYHTIRKSQPQPKLLKKSVGV